jgi:hypothetical protein
MHRSHSFAMQRVFFETKRSFPATNRATEFPLNNFTLLAADEERECAGSSRLASLRVGVSTPSLCASKLTTSPSQQFLVLRKALGTTATAFDMPMIPAPFLRPMRR